MLGPSRQVLAPRAHFPSFAMSLLTLLALAATTAGCAVRITAAGRQVEVGAHVPATVCENLGPVVGQSGGVPGAMNDLRNNAALLGGNFVEASAPAFDQFRGTTSSATIS